MRAKERLGIMLLFLYAFCFISCDKDNDSVENIAIMSVSPELVWMRDSRVQVMECSIEGDNEKLYIALNLNGIIADATSPKEANLGRSDAVNPLVQLMTAADEGLPLLMRKTDDGVDVYVNKEMMLPVVKMLPTLLESFGYQLGDMKELVSGLVGMIVPLIENSKETEIGLHLVPYVEEIPTPESMVLLQSFEKMMQKFAK